jgi:hypothetical protein
LKTIQNRLEFIKLFFGERENLTSQKKERIQSIHKKMKLHRSLNTMQDIEDWIQSSDKEI